MFKHKNDEEYCRMDGCGNVCDTAFPHHDNHSSCWEKISENCYLAKNFVKLNLNKEDFEKTCMDLCHAYGYNDLGNYDSYEELINKELYDGYLTYGGIVYKVVKNLHYWTI